MRASDLRRFNTASRVAFLAVAVAGCSTVAPVPIEPIETQTEELLGQVHYELQLDDIVLLNPYLDSNSPRVDEFEAVRQVLVDAAELLIDYSVDVIDLARLEQDDEAVAAFVPVLRAFYRRLGEISFVEPYLADIDIEVVAVEAAAQPNLTKALRVAVPVHESAADAVRALIAETSDRFDLAYDETYEKIVEEYRAFMAYTDILVVRRNSTLEKMLLLEAARGGDAGAWRSLLLSDERLRSRPGPDPAPSLDATDNAEAMLVEQLRLEAEIWDYLEPSWTNYQATLKELNSVAANVRSVLRVAGFFIESWDRAQRQLSTGRQAGFIAVTKDLAYFALRRAAR